MSSIKRYDERDNVQARDELIPGSPMWKEYYRVHPELMGIDMAQHDLPRVIGVGADVDNRFFLSMVTLLGHMGHENMVDGPVDSVKTQLTPERATEKIKGILRHMVLTP
jgi:hypothetical protein